MSSLSRRDFCRFLGGGLAGSLLLPSLSSWLTACASRAGAGGLQGLAPTLGDELRLASGFSSREFIRWGAPLNTRGEFFGYNNDFIAFRSLSPTEAWMWVNHESVEPGLVSGDWDMRRTRTQVEKEMRHVGGSLLRVRKVDGRWTWADAAGRHRRLDGFSKIPFAGGVKVQGQDFAIGTLANCAGGTTPWGTFLSCEENVDKCYGDRARGAFTRRTLADDHAWHRHFDHPPEHYGWVVEITPEPFAAKKLTSLGRFAHECATTVESDDGRCAVYMADDANDQCLYKFVAARPGSLEEGVLYAANIERGEWIPLRKKDHPTLLKDFRDELEVLTFPREAAHRVGASALDRPEDVEVHPLTGDVFVALTGNKSRGRPFGSILRIREEGRDPLAMRFSAETFLMGGEATGLACPDNLRFDARGNLWVTNDISGKEIGKGIFAPFGNNGLFLVPAEGKDAGRVIRVAQAPKDAEFTGPCFAPDGETLFLSVQHPGELSPAPDRLTSHWPDGGRADPCPVVLEISLPAPA